MSGIWSYIFDFQTLRLVFSIAGVVDCIILAFCLCALILVLLERAVSRSGRPIRPSIRALEDAYVASERRPRKWSGMPSDHETPVSPDFFDPR